MKKFKLFLKTALVAVLSLTFAFSLVACDDDDPNNNDGDNPAKEANIIYVTSYGGVALSGVTVELYSGNEKILEAKTTDDEGKVVYELPEGTFRASLSNLPRGYYEGGENPAPRTVKSSDATTNLYVASKVIVSEDGSPVYPTKSYLTGDVMYDFEQTAYTYNPDAAGKVDVYTVKLSQLLETKKAVVLNFWYTSCTWCNREYPAMKSAYLKYADDLEILAINDYATDDAEAVALKVISDEVPYLMCKDNAGVGNFIEKTGYPTSVMIDRYGVMTEITTTQLDEKFWTDWFAKYTADNYVPNFNAGNGAGDEDDFIADKPEDFNVSMPSSQTISGNTNINNTGKSIYFSEDLTVNLDGGKSTWPWDLTEDGTALYPTNSTHRGTLGVIYASIELDKDQVLAFDYKLSSVYGYDNFYVAVDARDGLGKQVLVNSGKQDWQPGYAYVALEKGTHEIAFTYARTSTFTVDDLAVNGLEDKVYIRNFRLLSADELNEELIKNGETLEFAYSVMRQYNYDTWEYDSVDGYYLASDGYYHIGDKNNPQANDPYLLADMTHSTPYFGTATSSLSSYYSEQMNKRGSVILNGRDYTNEFNSFITYSTNSAYTGMVPVTPALKNLLTAFCRNDGITDDTSWLLFCLSYRQYGVQKALEDPIKGLAYFSAFEAKVNNSEEDNYVNTVNFDTIIMPRGYVYKFSPAKDGVYYIHGLDAFVDDNQEMTDAWLFDDTINVSHSLANAIAESGSDRYSRTGEENNFEIYHYLKANKTYYIVVAFRVVEVMGSFDFRIDYAGETYDYLAPAAADYYVAIDDTNNLTLPVFADVEYREDLGYYVDKKSNRPIYVDLTEPTFLFSAYTISEILDESINSRQLNFDLSTYTVIDPDDPEGQKTKEVPLKVTIAGEELVGEDFTEVMKGYLEEVTPDCATLAGTVDGKPLTLTMNRQYLTVNYDGESKKVLISATAMNGKDGQTVYANIGGCELEIILKLEGENVSATVNYKKTCTLASKLYDADNTVLTGTLDDKALTLNLSGTNLTIAYNGATYPVKADLNAIKSAKGQTVKVTTGEGDNATDITLVINIYENASKETVLSATAETESVEEAFSGTSAYAYDVNSYGLHVVDKQLYKILQLYNFKFAGHDDDNEWLRACWYWIHVGPEA